MSLGLARLRSSAEALAAPFPPLLAEAEKLAATVMLGTHGRRRAGRGDEFWQYRPAHAGDEARHIDWRRSARSDAHYVREKEWQAAQSVWLWADPGQSMAYASKPDLPEKGHRARVLALAAAILMIRGGERVGLVGPDALRPAAGEAQIARIAARMLATDTPPDYAAPDLSTVLSHGRVLLVSDFMADPAPLISEIERNSAHDVRGVLLQVIDPVEEAFPFRGRSIFESIGKSVRYETLRASDLRAAYLGRLNARKAALGDLARRSGWMFHTTRTSEPPQGPLLWTFGALERRH